MPPEPPAPDGRIMIVRPDANGSSRCENKTFCGCGEAFVMYEEDENGNKIEGTEEWGCDPNP
ncbi:hypothetical protein [Psychromarinibacter sediminicola]|nr:hypothetical protein [Psychromarinibacter sediminicola]